MCSILRRHTTSVARAPFAEYGAARVRMRLIPRLHTTSVARSPFAEREWSLLSDGVAARRSSMIPLHRDERVTVAGRAPFDETIKRWACPSLPDALATSFGWGPWPVAILAVSISSRFSFSSPGERVACGQRRAQRRILVFGRGAFHPFRCVRSATRETPCIRDFQQTVYAKKQTPCLYSRPYE